MEDGDDTLPDGQQAVCLSHDNHVSQQTFSFDFSNNRSGPGSSSEDDSHGLMVSDLPSWPNENLSYLEPEAAEHSGNDALSNARDSSDEKARDSAPIATMEVIKQSPTTDPEMKVPQIEETDIMYHGQKLQVSLPFIPSDVRDQYKEVHSNAVERILDLPASPDDGELLTVELTDGTQCMIPLLKLEGFENGSQALETYFTGMERAGRKRKTAPNDDWESDSSSNGSDVMDLDADTDAEEPDEAVAATRSRRRRTQEPTTSRNATESNSDASDDSDAVIFDSRRRSLRRRKPRFPQASLQESEHDGPSRSPRDEDGDDFILPVVSDIASTRRKRSSMLRSRRPPARKRASTRRGAVDSDIEFEQPRRSSRATRNVRYLQDDFDLDEDSFTQVEEKPGIPKIASVKELFRPVPPDSSFAINGGVDPITSVPDELVNNSKNVLFRCTSCNRGWHQHHLPLIGSPSPGREQEIGALKDYFIDWQCNECTVAQQKIHRLVAWRAEPTASTARPAFAQLSDDDKEYLVKWEGMSYFHCTWMPGAWIFGVAASAMRTSFAKKAVEVDLFKVTEKEAIPDEYLMIDIIFRVKLDSAVPRANSRQEDVDNLPHISKVLVKFQGLGYDDVVWDEPPKTNSGELYDAFKVAYEEYLAGKYFKHSLPTKMRERIKAFKEEELEEVDVQPAGLKRGKLMGYQLEGLNWLLNNFHSGRSVVLADEMGLGKTVQVISLVVYLVQENPKCWPFLISVPNATCPNWRREFKQWAPELRVVTYHGGKESQDLAYKHELFPHGSREMAAHVVIMSYDSTQDPKTSQRFNSVKWAGLVVDEGQRLKNDRSLLYQALRVMKIPFRLLLTGTPLQNNKRELFNLIQFIDHSQSAEKLDEEFQVLDKETLPRLHEKIRPYFLRRTKVGVLKFLPPMAQIILPVTMTVIQEKLSKSIMAKNPQLIKAIFANSKMNKKERGSLNNILMQLRKCLCHPFMYSEAIEEKHDDPVVIHRNLVEASAKLLLLEQMLPKLKERGHRVLIFSQFLQQLDIIEDFLIGIGYQYRRLDGNLSSLEKQRRIDAYNEPGSAIFAFLLSTRAGGVGINLATADTVIIMDPDFNPHQDIQALSRAHRIGQKQKVLCFQLMTKDTVEERIMQIGKKKMALDHALIESLDDDEIAGDDLESILAHGAQALFSDDYQKGAIHYDGPSIDRLLDRSQTEQTKVDDEGSAEAQFTYAKVWSNDKANLEDELKAAAEAEAPEPISSSVWDKILAEREEEARRQAEANQERLGRGERRRTTLNYKSDTLAEYLQDVGGPNASDSSDDFAAAGSSSSSDGDNEAEGKKRTTSPPKPKTGSVTPTTQSTRTKKIDTRAQQKTTSMTLQRNSRLSEPRASKTSGCPTSKPRATPVKTSFRGKTTSTSPKPKPSPIGRSKRSKPLHPSKKVVSPKTPVKRPNSDTGTRITCPHDTVPSPQMKKRTANPHLTPRTSPAASDPIRATSPMGSPIPPSLPLTPLTGPRPKHSQAMRQQK
ncbi:putative helicase-DNA-binding protein [Metarhizium acridum CQMa 102]|uniref:Putative helicase-DNA-binding protein n=1 Tax=Metarhizium acridum (strain CQMa 102) TaxID=655827 RepID=E9E389_METAQ|nr:putative helicase-DNA-binding protein [Metarhizium acridum CQMa 102]EFY89684.1 putative helicase-DNA-binding protein [Metarhizium acridum CQMa 102]